MKNRILLRNEVEEKRTWDLSAIYQSEDEVQEAMQELRVLTEKIVSEYKGNLINAENINTCLDEMRKVNVLSGLISSYRFLAVSVDMTNSENQSKSMEASNLLSKVKSRLSFVEGEILENDESVIEKAMEESEENRHYLEDLLREKPYALTIEVEKALATLAPVMNAPMSIYNKAKLQDMDFGTFEVDGKEYPLSFVLYENHYDYDNDMKVRRAAFEAFSKKLKDYEHTVAGVYQTQVQKEKAMADLKGFDSVIDYLLFDQKVTREMYDRQIDVIYEELAPHMRKYAKLLKKIHGIEKMTFNDLKLSVDPSYEPPITVEESKAYVKDGLKILGKDYAEMIDRAFQERWIDFVQNKGKSTGAFCSSPYGRHPFILISWTERMREVFVLAHELGHAGHFYLSQQNQNIFDSRPSLYFIEAPSTMNEMIMANYLLKQNEEKRFRRWVLSSMISRTYYHNFVTHMLEAHYQREVYKIIDEGGSVHAKKLNELKRETLEKFWGEEVEINPGAENTWMRQQHYYKGLYPYTYSAGLTIATEVSKRILREGEAAVEDWKNVLKTGGKKNPVELAAMAKVDITTDQPLKNTIAYIGEIIDEIEKLTEELGDDL
ncbi:oligoendopeptidase F [Proteiniclasticum sp. SCR006]|uniref:Oligopeptidase F n=1 Tax=Proteiniclasticum aestuarii TaxID=2817862 RepID=A0A939H9P7_9CLOT|nr:oligoendopeptidase F [Proteiniclasticum aestuarii]MBO1263962.1 oligoendopeptidase F [Proteiniclasticum aestuarii]